MDKQNLRTFYVLVADTRIAEDIPNIFKNICSSNIIKNGTLLK